MKVKEKVKKFYEEHKTGCIVAGATGLVIVGEIIGWKCCCKTNCLKPGRVVITNDHINDTLKKAFDTYKDTGFSGFISHYDTPIRLDELGKLGELAKADGCIMEQELTHFIAIGKPLTKK